MKIFNWVHRKFQKNVDSYSVCPKKEEFKKAETVTNETDRETLLNHVTLVDVIDGWKDGILTIGTFGFDSVTENEYSVDNVEEEKEHVEEAREYSVSPNEEKLNPTVVRAFNQEFQKVITGSDVDTCTLKPDQLITIVDDTPLLRFLESPQVRSDDVLFEKKKRTTLADLLSAESSDGVVGKLDPDEEPKDTSKKSGSRTKNNLSFTKKIMPGKGEDSRSIKKIQRLVTKMLKKKIHPDYEGKINRKEGSTFENGSKMMIDIGRALGDGC